MESILYSIIGFLLATGILVTLHELGHYLVGRLCGVKALSFSIGFGGTLWSRRMGADNTEWKIGALPLGGYVQFLSEKDESNPVPPEEKHRSFESKKPWQRIAIVAAGPVTNLLAAVFFYAIVFSAGIEQDRARFAAPAEKTVLGLSGLREAGEFVSWDGRPVLSLQDLQWQWFKQLGNTSGHAVVEVKTRSGTSRSFQVSRAALPQGEDFSAWMEALGLEPDMPPMPPIVSEVVPNRPAYLAGIKPGDRIVKIADTPVAHWKDVLDSLKSRADRSTDIVFTRNGVEQKVTLIPETASDQTGKTVGKIGIAPERLKINRADYRVVVRYPFTEAVGRAVYKTYELCHMTLLALYKMMSGQLSLKNISGPVTMADLAGHSLQAGWVVYLNYLGLISISLGVMNLLPIPVLDGGHIVYELLALLRGGRPVSIEWVVWGQKLGFMMLGALMLLAFYNDWYRFFK